MECTFLAFCPLGKNCWQKFRMAIFGHSKFIAVFLGKIVRRNSEWPFLAIPNLNQSFWEKLSERIQNGHFLPIWIYTSHFRKNCQKKIGVTIFGIPNLYQSLWKKLLEKFGMTIFGIPNLYQSLWEKLSEKIWNGHFWQFQIYTSVFGKNCWKNLEWPFLAIPNLYQSFWGKLPEKISDGHFLPFWIFSDNFPVHITLIECNGHERSEICTFLDFYCEI